MTAAGIAEEPAPGLPSRAPVVRATLTVTGFLLTAQAATALTYSAMAALFGRSYEMDAFVIGTTLPQYAVAVFVASLTFALVPVLTEYAAAGKAEAEQLAGQIVAVIGGGLLLVSIVGGVTSDFAIQRIAPHFPAEFRGLAVHVSWWAWPSVVAAGLAATLTAIENVHRRFAWAAAVPAIGGIVTLALLVALGHRFGPAGMAAATTAGTVMQVVLLTPTVLRRCRLPRNGRHPGLASLLHLLWPLILSGLFLRATPIVDRYLVSGLGEGNIAALAYAGNLSRFMAMTVSSGVAVVVFPQLASTIAAAERGSFRRLVSGSLRLMWLVSVPVALIGAALSAPLIRLVFERGNFGAADTIVVATLFRIYLASFVMLCLGNISGRAIYALRMTRTFSVFGVAESLLYFGYNAAFVRWIGVNGAAVAYFLYCAGSMTWQLALVSRAGRGRRLVPIDAIVRTVACATFAAVAAALAARFVSNVWLSPVVGGAVGVIVYIWLIGLLRSPEERLLRLYVRRRVRAVGRLGRESS